MGHEATSGVHRKPKGRRGIPVAEDYDDPAYSGGHIDRPALKHLLGDIEKGLIDVVVVYKIDR